MYFVFRSHCFIILLSNRCDTCSSGWTTMVPQLSSHFHCSALLHPNACSSQALEPWSPYNASTLFPREDQHWSCMDRHLPPSGWTFPHRGSHVRAGPLPPCVSGGNLFKIRFRQFWNFFQAFSHTVPYVIATGRFNLMVILSFPCFFLHGFWGCIFKGRPPQKAHVLFGQITPPSARLLGNYFHSSQRQIVFFALFRTD